MLLVGLTQTPQPLKLADVVLQEIDVRTTVAHVCDTDLPAALELLTDAAAGAGRWSTGSWPSSDVVTDGFDPLAAGSGPRQGRSWSRAVADVAVLGTGRMGVGDGSPGGRARGTG